MNTDEMSGISLLQLQDFPGQGTALVGMMDSHLKPKPFAFARPEAFRAFFRDRLVLASLPPVHLPGGGELHRGVLPGKLRQDRAFRPPGVHLDRPRRVPGRQPVRPALPPRASARPWAR